MSEGSLEDSEGSCGAGDFACSFRLRLPLAPVVLASKGRFARRPCVLCAPMPAGSSGRRLPEIRPICRASTQEVRNGVQGVEASPPILFLTVVVFVARAPALIEPRRLNGRIAGWTARNHARTGPGVHKLEAIDVWLVGQPVEAEPARGGRVELRGREERCDADGCCKSK